MSSKLLGRDSAAAPAAIAPFRNKMISHSAAPTWFGSDNQMNPKSSAGSSSSMALAPTSRVLIVEDELFVAWHLESLVRDLDLDVCALVPDGEGAIEQASDLDADLILMDISLSGRIDGVEAARRIRSERDTAIVFITAYSDAATLARIKQEIPGAPVLAKPVSLERLRTAIASVLRSHPC
jgi:CheY-like chemotaxis protein